MLLQVVCIFGVSGALRCDELVNVQISDIEEHKNMFLIKIPKTKTKISKSFTVNNEFYNIVKKYCSLRPPNIKTERFFIGYRDGKCTTQPVGKNKFAGFPRTIAKYLNLPEPESYTGILTIC